MKKKNRSKDSHKLKSCICTSLCSWPWEQGMNPLCFTHTVLFKHPPTFSQTHAIYLLFFGRCTHTRTSVLHVQHSIFCSASHFFPPFFFLVRCFGYLKDWIWIGFQSGPANMMLSCGLLVCVYRHVAKGGGGGFGGCGRTPPFSRTKKNNRWQLPVQVRSRLHRR